MLDIAPIKEGDSIHRTMVNGEGPFTVTPSTNILLEKSCCSSNSAIPETANLIGESSFMYRGANQYGLVSTIYCDALR